MSFIEQKFGEPLHPIVKQYFTSSRDIESWSKEHMRRYHEEAIRWVLEHAYKNLAGGVTCERERLDSA